MITICVINQKGGVGKSSTCLHLAGAFAVRGKSTLLIDADPQGSLSQGLLGPTTIESLSVSQTLAALFDDGCFVSDFADITRSTEIDSIRLVPANHHLASYNRPNPDRQGVIQFALREMLATADEFDIALIDCPPNLYLTSWAALLSADFVVIPVPPEDFGTQGLRAIHQAVDNARLLNPALQSSWHLITRSDRRLVIHRKYEARLRNNYGAQTFDTVIPEANAFKVSVTVRRPVEQFDPRSKAAASMRRLADEIWLRFEPDLAGRKAA